jgi:hypothetical protein
VLADVGCRNTPFNHRPQSAAEWLPRFRAAARELPSSPARDEGAGARGDRALSQGAARTLTPRELFRRSTPGLRRRRHARDAAGRT